MPIKLQGSFVKLMCNNHGIAKIYCENNVIYSSSNTFTYTVTYHVDTGVTYQEEVDEGASCLSPKTFTPTKSGWEFVGWRQDKTASDSTLSSLTMGDEPVMLYAVFQQTVTVTYYNGSTSARQWDKKRYYNNGNVANPTFTLTQAALSGWTARGWSTSTAGNGGIIYNNGAAFTRDSNVTLYGLYNQTITLTYYNCSTSAASTSGTRYYNPGSGSIANPTFTLTPAPLSGWTFRGWATSPSAAAGIAYSSISGTAFAASTTVYAAYYQTITLSYNGNGSTSGSTAAQTGTRYWNTGNISNPSFTLRSNGFSRSGYTFSKWAFGNTGGTQYAAGASITLSTSTVMYAVWIADSVVVTGNSNYLTVTGDMRCGVWYRYGDDDDTSTITVNYSGYAKVTIVFEIELNQVDAGDYGRVSINGVSVIDTNSSKYPDFVQGGNGHDVYHYTATYTNVNKISVVSHVQNYNGTGAWSDIKISIYSATLSM